MNLSPWRSGRFVAPFDRGEKSRNTFFVITLDGGREVNSREILDRQAGQEKTTSWTY